MLRDTAGLRRPAVCRRDSISAGLAKDVELTTRQILGNYYDQQGDCALHIGATEIHLPNDAGILCKIGIMLCLAGFHGRPY